MIPNLPAGFVEFCAARCGCLEKASVMQSVVDAIGRIGPRALGTVSLPSAPVVKEAPAEETQEPPPSGWRDRPALL